MRAPIAVMMTLVAVSCSDDPVDCTDLAFDVADCSACSLDEPLAPIEGAALPARMFVGVGNRYWWGRTEVTIDDDGAVDLAFRSRESGNEDKEARVTSTFARAVLEAALPALVDITTRPELDRLDDEPAYEFNVHPDDAGIGDPFYAESEVYAAPALCCVAEGLQSVSECALGHRL